MNLRKTLIAASLAAMSINISMAAEPMMAAGKAQSSPLEAADLIARLMSQRGNHGLIADHGFALASEHPGVVGTKVHRVNHMFKNVRVWNSESVVVTNDAGSIISESISERRHGLGQGQSFAGKAGVNFDVNPAISGKQATDLVVNKLAPTGTHIVASKAELIVYPVMKSVRVASAVNKAEAALNAMDLEEVVDHYELAYFVQTRMSSNGRPSLNDSIVSGTAPYSYKLYRNGVLISGATSTSYSFTAQSTDNGAMFKATVTDSASTPTTATSGTATEKMVNGGFESGTTPWAGTTGDIGSWTGEPAASGTRNAWMGGNGSAVTESLYQSVAIPSTAVSASLTFALHIDTAESGTTAYDKLTVTVKNSSGTVLTTLATYSNVNAATGYQTRTFDLSAYKGQTVRISFSETEDSSLPTSFVLDNVSLMVK